MLKKHLSLFYNKDKFKTVGVSSKTLVSVLVGASSKRDLINQFKKLEATTNLPQAGLPDIISDLSLYASRSSLYKYIIDNYPDFIVSTLPIYQCKANNQSIDPKELLSVIQEQVESGVSFITIHPTPTNAIVELAKKRLVPWTSRGGAIVIKDMAANKFLKENVYLQILDEIIKITSKNKTAISIGASFRSANIFDSLDECQMKEFKIQKQIADYIASNGGEVIIEGPGHCPPNKFKIIGKHYRKMGYPIMPLGPIPTDVAIGEDHISSAIGAVLLGMEKCVGVVTAVTREEHTGGLPSLESTIEAIKSAKIAAHIIDMYKLEDYVEDKSIAIYRQLNSTCVYGKESPGCSRCANVCPLTFHLK